MRIGPEDVLLAVRAADKESLLRHLARHAAGRIGEDAEAILARRAAREALGSTGIGRGTAMPHARLPGLARPFCCFCRLQRPIPFAAIDDAPVDLAVLVLTPAAADSAHLALLAAAARRLRDPAICTQLRQSVEHDAISRLMSH